ncbi:hypothetical protein E1200_15535 [Actinomadura sp. GC306]|uniref:hypothetical protein n=1 Tax=Actinomadura sp. GC306 TaxID=2530367 RepID=UPI0010505067|nr:hypothetical protein [Actinomadura sp. GC306]TDC67155.1 hypothetical protein E1200_15535 [Actinomadura sp. GC306]
MSTHVVRLDLKDCDAAEAVSRVAALLATPRDLGMLLVEDTAAAVVRHRAAFEALDGSRQVEQLLCLVLGRQERAADEQGHVLRLPRNIERRTLWVIERTGVDWPLQAAGRARRRDHRGGDGFERLAELLRMPGMFRRTHELLGRVPHGAAVPGLHIAGSGGNGQMEFLQALRFAIRRMQDPTSPSAVRPAAGTPAGRAALHLARGGMLQRAFDDADDAVAEARQAADGLPGTAALIRRTYVEAAFEGAGDRLAELRDRLAGLFQAVPADERLTKERRTMIAARGVELPAPEEERRPRDELRAWLDASLKGGASLTRIDMDLREWAGTLERSDVHGRRLSEICSDPLLRGLQSPPAMPPPQPWLPAAGAVCAALAGLSPLGVAGGLVMAVLWTALVALSVIRGPGGRLEEHSRGLGFNAFGALAGGIAGGLGGSAGLPAAGWAAAVSAAVAGALIAIACSWRARALRWAEDADLAAAEQALQRLRELLGRAVADWSGLDRRLETIDELNLLRQALEGVREELKTRCDALDGDGLPQPSRSVVPYGERVHSWLGGLVLAAVRPALQAGPGGEVEKLASMETGRLVNDWESAVEQGQSPEEMPFVTDAAPAPVDPEDLAYFVEQVSRDAEAEMWQMCAPGDLRLLDASPRPPVLRFGPRPAGDGAVYPPETVHVAAPTMCGVLRLVPLHSHVIEWTWGQGEDDGGEM